MKQNELAKSLKLFIGLTCIILAICGFVIVPKLASDISISTPQFLPSIYNIYMDYNNSFLCSVI